jgi:aminopeptidase
VVLVQSTNFRLDGFRLRVELFKLGLKVIEHVHLSRMPGAQGEHYIEALAYDPQYFRGVGHALKARIDQRRARRGAWRRRACWCSIRRSNRPS